MRRRRVEQTFKREREMARNGRKKNGEKNLTDDDEKKSYMHSASLKPVFTQCVRFRLMMFNAVAVHVQAQKIERTESEVI